MESIGKSSTLPRFVWQDNKPDEKVVQTLINSLGVLPPIARALAGRGLLTRESAERFLSPDLGKHLTDPFALPGVSKAVDRLWSAVRSREKIVVFGDFDADGVSATSILVRALKAVGGEAIPFIPSRQKEGYGLTKGAIDRCLAEASGAKVFVTVDCGIASVKEVEYVNSLGLDVLLTDHHEPEGALPPAYVIVNPRVACGAPENGASLWRGRGVQNRARVG